MIMKITKRTQIHHQWHRAFAVHQPTTMNYQPNHQSELIRPNPTKKISLPASARTNMSVFIHLVIRQPVPIKPNQTESNHEKYKKKARTMCLLHSTFRES